MLTTVIMQCVYLSPVSAGSGLTVLQCCTQRQCADCLTAVFQRHACLIVGRLTASQGMSDKTAVIFGP